MDLDIGDDQRIPATGKLFGKYRGIVVGVDDPEERARYQVFVYGVHRFFDDKELPSTLTREKLLKLRDGGATLNSSDLEGLTEAAVNDESSGEDTGSTGPTGKDPRKDFENYPWAETVCYAGKHFGDIGFYSIGDPVWIEFEGGSRDHPVIVGGWINRGMGVTDKLGINDLVPEQTAKYPDTRHLWVRADRWGNSLTQSGMPDESWVRIASGLGTSTNWRLDDSIRHETIGTFGVEAGAISMRAGEQGIFLDGTDVNIQACAANVSRPYAGDAGGMLGLYSAWDSNYYAVNELWIGQYPQRKHGQDGTRIWSQSKLATIAPKKLILGLACKTTKQAYSTVGMQNSEKTKSTECVDIEGEVYVAIRAGADGEQTGLLGLYSNFEAELWAHDLIWIGQYLMGITPCQSQFTLIHSRIIYVGACLFPESPLAPQHTLATKEVWAWATDVIFLRTCGAAPHSPGYCDPGMAMTWVKGDIVIWASHDVIICANHEVRICGPVKTPVLDVRVVDCIIEINKECPPNWIPIGDIRACCCSSSAPPASTSSTSTSTTSTSTSTSVSTSTPPVSTSTSTSTSTPSTSSTSTSTSESVQCPIGWYPLHDCETNDAIDMYIWTSESKTILNKQDGKCYKIDCHADSMYMGTPDNTLGIGTGYSTITDGGGCDSPQCHVSTSSTSTSSTSTSACVGYKLTLCDGSPSFFSVSVAHHDQMRSQEKTSIKYDVNGNCYLLTDVCVDGPTTPIDINDPSEAHTFINCENCTGTTTSTSTSSSGCPSYTGVYYKMFNCQTSVVSPITILSTLAELYLGSSQPIVKIGGDCYRIVRVAAYCPDLGLAVDSPTSIEAAYELCSDCLPRVCYLEWYSSYNFAENATETVVFNSGIGDPTGRRVDQWETVNDPNMVGCSLVYLQRRTGDDCDVLEPPTLTLAEAAEVCANGPQRGE